MIKRVSLYFTSIFILFAFSNSVLNAASESPGPGASGPTQPPLLLNVTSTTASVVGVPEIVTKVDENNLRGIRVGMSKEPGPNFGHSFLILEVCVEGTPCARPLEIEIQPGMDGDGNLVYSAKTYSDAYAAMNLGKHTLKEVSIKIDGPDGPVKKRDFIRTLSTKIKTSAETKYNILTNNCATNISKLLEESGILPAEQWSKTIRPSGLLNRVAKETNAKVNSIETVTAQATKMMKKLRIKGGLEEYRKLPSSQRKTCNTSIASAKVNVQAFLERENIKYVALIRQDGKISSTASCEDLLKNGVDRFRSAIENLVKGREDVRDCLQLNEMLVYMENLELNKAVRRGMSADVKVESSKQIEAKKGGELPLLNLQQQLSLREQQQKELLTRLGEVKDLVTEIDAKVADKKSRREELTAEEKQGFDQRAKGLADSLEHTLGELEKSRATRSSYEELLYSRAKGGAPTVDPAFSKFMKLVADCQNTCSLGTRK